MDDRYSSRDVDLKALLRSTPFFADLPDSVVEQAVAHVVTREHPANRVILLENDWGLSLIHI